MSNQKQWHGGRMLFALARYFDWYAHRMMSEFFIDGGIADLVFVSRAGYATEIEIKTSLADWNADRHKAKWKVSRPHVARFFYAIPETLEHQIPDSLPATAGILIVRQHGRNYDQVSELRAAVRQRALRLSDQQRIKMAESAYFRFWRMELYRLQRTIHSTRGVI